MKLLIDQSLAHRVAAALADLFPGSVHVRDVGLARAEDADVWLHARDHGFAIVSKGADFHQRAMLLGPPPKVVWLRPPGCSTAAFIDLARGAAAPMRAFHADPERSLLVVAPLGVAHH